MRFFFPDSQDLVDPSYDFVDETRDFLRIRHQDDLYAHEIFEFPPYDGLLVSKAIVDGKGGAGGRYTVAQRHRLMRRGSREFFRLGPCRLLLMADCGAFSYVNEEAPPFTVTEILDFYGTIGCDFGISVDHVILAYQPDWDTLFGVGEGAPSDARRRQELTLELARAFLQGHAEGGYSFEPMGVAQGWSPASYRRAVESLQAMGFQYIALGGLVPLKTPEILAVLEAVSEVRRPEVRLHLLGVTRPQNIPAFSAHGVASFDSTSPLRQAFKDGKDNYYTSDRTFTAVRVPQVDGNPKLQRDIQAGRIAQDRARLLERRCMESLREYELDLCSVDRVLECLAEYEHLIDPKRDHSFAYRDVLTARPWRDCSCAVCRGLGYQVILFRGAERNRRRGFHNLWVTYQRLRGTLAQLPQPIDTVSVAPGPLS
jgi:hypothetical protein